MGNEYSSLYSDYGKTGHDDAYFRELEEMKTKERINKAYVDGTEKGKILGRYDALKELRQMLRTLPLEALLTNPDSDIRYIAKTIIELSAQNK